MGIGLQVDSFLYLSAANSIVNGDGYGRTAGDGSFRPLTSYPPLYPAALTVTRLIGLELQAGARLINGAAFGALVLLSGLAVFHSTRSSWAALLGASLLLVSSTLYVVHAWAMSDGIYLALSVGSLFAAFCYLRSPNRRSLLIIASIGASAASFTRFIGITLVIVIAISILIHRDMARHARKLHLLVVGAIGTFPLTVFGARNLLLTGIIANRPSASWHPPNSEHFRSGASKIASWFLPLTEDQIPGEFALFFVGAVISIVIAYVAYWLLGRRRDLHKIDATSDWFPFLIAMHFLTYMAVLLISMAFFDSQIRFIDRILSPLLVSLVLLFVLAASFAWNKASRSVRPLIAAAMLALLFARAIAGLEALDELRDEGLGFNSIPWRASQTIEFVKSLADTHIYTNDLPALYLLAGKQASMIPVQTFGTSGELRQDFGEQLMLMREQMESQGALMVLVGHSLESRLDPPYLATITEGLKLVEQFPDGMVFLLPQQ